MDEPNLQWLRRQLADMDEPGLIILVGSRAHGNERSDSDWDLAVQFAPDLDEDVLAQCGRLEELRERLAWRLQTTVEKIDLIDIPAAGLAMRAEIARHGKVLKGEDTLYWYRLLQRTWRDLEDYDWDCRHLS